MKNFIALVLILMLGGTQTSEAQVSENTTLFKDILALDSELFDQGFNQCKPNIFEARTDEKLEFFHDKGGIQNREKFLEAVKRNICSNLNEKPIRTLVAGSSQVFPLDNNGVLYGAIQQGVHQFHSKGKDPAVNGYTVAKFTHVWLLRDGIWKLKSALSYDHQQKTGKAAGNISIHKMVKQRVKLMELTIASMSWSLYFRDLKN